MHGRHLGGVRLVVGPLGQELGFVVEDIGIEVRIDDVDALLRRATDGSVVGRVGVRQGSSSWSRVALVQSSAG
ncbi:MAG: hypothetical protein R2705_15760 [Ilumatobacteraceae bacterium]